MPRRRPESADWGAIRAAYAAGEPVAALARRHGLAPSTIYRRARRESWRRAAGDGAAPGRAGAPPGKVSPAGELAKLRALAARLREQLEAMIEAGQDSGPVLGGRESPASLLLKLCQISEKIVAIERRLAGRDAATPAELNDEDRAILARFKQRYGVD